MTATVRPSDLVAGEFSSWCRACESGSGFGLTERAARAWATDHNAIRHPGENTDPDTINLTGMARDLLHVRDLADGKDSALTAESQRYDVLLTVWTKLLGMDDPGDALAYAERIVVLPVRAAVVPF